MRTDLTLSGAVFFVPPSAWLSLGCPLESERAGWTRVKGKPVEVEKMSQRALKGIEKAKGLNHTEIILNCGRFA